MTYNDTNGNPSGLGTITIIGKEDAERAYGTFLGLMLQLCCY